MTEVMAPEAWSFETRQIHAGTAPDPTTLARAVPIYQTGAFAFQDTAHAARLFTLEEKGNIYSRIQNPTHEALERRIASLEGAVDAVAVASGHAAVALAILNLAGAGDHVVSSATLYGGTYNLLRHLLPEYGIETTFVDDPDDPDSWRRALRPTTKVVFGETVGNPRNNLLDIRAVADVAHAAGVPFVLDNTGLTPYLLRPAEHGVDVVVHSTSKYLSGHGTVIGGVVVDNGTFDFGAHADRFPKYGEPDPSFHGLRFWDEFGPGAYARRLRLRLLRDLGPATTPFTSFLVLQGLETLSLRMERHVSNALELARWLEARPEVSAVHYPGLPSSPWHGLARTYLARGAGGVVSFELAGGREAGARFIDGLELVSHLANIGDVRSLAIHPASTTHYQLTPEQQRAAGVAPGLIRFSTGIEGIEDITSDLATALAAATSAPGRATKQ
ncbi:O-acetylhomoserine aminocarboxypropyltransferase/cysteine synthase family protein [Streptomyces sp. NPDC029674]|uniref:O-acetylhomoserine aminocarboxypropyltransferase/cysteine synthase family protein n=1 Tax=Streptomyces sp. NPDC029674 TaxID=3365297 RepID=UPI0038515F8D